jgi:hypothetical protein
MRRIEAGGLPIPSRIFGAMPARRFAAAAASGYCRDDRDAGYAACSSQAAGSDGCGNRCRWLLELSGARCRMHRIFLNVLALPLIFLMFATPTLAQVAAAPRSVAPTSVTVTLVAEKPFSSC